jgi:hypothetical protein
MTGMRRKLFLEHKRSDPPGESDAPVSERRQPRPGKGAWRPGAADRAQPRHYPSPTGGCNARPDLKPGRQRGRRSHPQTRSSPSPALAVVRVARNPSRAPHGGLRQPLTEPRATLEAAPIGDGAGPGRLRRPRLDLVLVGRHPYGKRPANYPSNLTE